MTFPSEKEDSPVFDKIKFNTGTGSISQKKDDAFTDNDAGDDFFLGPIV